METDPSAPPERDDLVETLSRHGRMFYRHGWVFGTAGNMSARLESDAVVITATGRHKGELGDGDFVECRLEELTGDGGPGTSSDSIIHRTVYEHLPDVGAVYHVHEPHGVAATVREGDGTLAFRGFPMVKALGIEDVEEGVEIPVFPDTGRARDLAAKLDDYLADCDGTPDVPGVVAERHGIYAWGASPFTARRHVEALAHLFEVRILADESR